MTKTTTFPFGTKKEGGQIVSRKRYGYNGECCEILFAEKRLKEL